MSNLDSATDELNRLLSEAEATFRAMRLGVEAKVELTAERSLMFTKTGSEWGLMVLMPGAECPLLKTSRENRIMAAAVLGTLAKALRANHAEMVHEVAEASRMVRDFLYPVEAEPSESEAK